MADHSSPFPTSESQSGDFFKNCGKGNPLHFLSFILPLKSRLHIFSLSLCLSLSLCHLGRRCGRCQSLFLAFFSYLFFSHYFSLFSFFLLCCLICDTLCSKIFSISDFDQSPSNLGNTTLDIRNFCVCYFSQGFQPYGLLLRRQGVTCS